jgi:tetratricopeptide (TPR) repeat protein
MPPGLHAISLSLSLSLTFGLATGRWATTALAQEAGATPGASATRPQLIDAARAAHKAGDHFKAAALYRRAADMMMGPTLGWALALEQEEAGELADSYFDAQECLREATADRKLADRDRILRDCQDLELRLKPRIGYVVVEVAGRPAGVELSVVGQTGGKVVSGVPYVVTPGSVTIKAKAPGRIIHWESVDVAAGETRTFKVDLTPMPDGSDPLTMAQKQEIRAHYQRASRDYDLGKFDEAIDEYQVIYEIDGDPVMLYNLAQAYRLADQPEKAIQFYRRYLQRSPEARNRDAVEQKIAALAKSLAEHGKAAPPISP